MTAGSAAEVCRAQIVTRWFFVNGSGRSSSRVAVRPAAKTPTVYVPGFTFRYFVMAP